MKQSLRQRKGFTLIELLTAVAITTVILAVLIGMTRMSMDAWKESSDRARASRLAKESLEVLAKDLEGIVIRKGNDYQWLYTQMDKNVERGPTATAEMRNPLEMAFFTAATDRYDGRLGTASDKGGNISTVFYRMLYKDQLGGDFKVYSLYRNLVNPDETFDNHLALKKGDDTDDDEGLINSAPSSDRVTAPSNFLAENVYNLTVTYVFEYNDNSGNVRQKRVPVMLAGSDYDKVSITGNTIETEPIPLTGGGDDISGRARLVSVELGILVLNDSAMNVLDKKNFTDQEDFSEFIKENSHYFTKAVVLPRP